MSKKRRFRDFLSLTFFFYCIIIPYSGKMTLERLQNPQGSTEFSSIKKTCSLKRKVCNDLSDLPKDNFSDMFQSK